MTATEPARDPTADVAPDLKAGTRAAWALGDYHRFAKATVWELGPVLVDACAIFAPDHQAVADEMVRVCRPGGTIGMLNFTPEIDDFFAVFAPYGPPPPGP